MRGYMRDDSREEFDEIFDIATKLTSRRRSSRQKATETLISTGRKAVGPLMYILHCEYTSDDPEEEYQELCEKVEAILVQIGEEVLPDLEYFATEDSCLIPINEFAQDAIFAVMGQEGEDRKKVCHHRMWYFYQEREKKMWKCLFCDTEFEYDTPSSDGRSGIIRYHFMSLQNSE